MVLHPAAWAGVAAERKPSCPQLGLFADTVTVLLFPKNADSLVQRKVYLTHRRSLDSTVISGHSYFGAALGSQKQQETEGS